MQISNDTIKKTAYTTAAGAAIGAGAAYGIQKGAKAYQASKAAKAAKAAEEAAKKPIRTQIKLWATTAWTKIKEAKNTLVDKTKTSLESLGKAEKLSKSAITKGAIIGAVVLPAIYLIKKAVTNNSNNIEE